METVIDSLQQFWQFTGFANCTWQHLVMILIGLIFITLGIVKKWEPLLLVPIGFGIIVGNIPLFFDPATAPAPVAAPAGPGLTIKSPLPGIIISIDVKEGQAVKRGQKLAVIEAMKMENDILAECDGTITAIHARKGDSVLEGADIVTIG